MPDGKEHRPLTVDPSDPSEFAESLLRRGALSGISEPIRCFGGDFYQWKNGRYVPLEGATVEAAVLRELRMAVVVQPDGGFKRFKPKMHNVNELVYAMRRLTHLPASGRAPPFWISDSPYPPEELVACSNGLLHLPTLKLLPHTPDFFSFNALDYPYDLDAPKPEVFLYFLDSLWGDDQEMKETLLEILGYLLVPDTSQQKMFMLIGPKRAGKGTITRLTRNLLGPHNCCGPTLGTFASHFALQALIGKLVAIFPDARLRSGAGSQTIIERLLSISGEDALSIDRKYHDPIDFKLNTRILMSSNELPPLTDPSGALASRFIFLRLKKSFIGKEDLELDAKLKNERPGILNLAIEGLNRLRQRGHFRQPEASQSLVTQMEEISSPVAAFINERCMIESGRITAWDDIYEEWCKWCGDRGRHPTNKQTFARDLHAVCPSVKTVQRGPKVERIRCLEGLGLQ